jgi:hypothetical protein
MCDQTGIRRIHLDCRPETLKCALLDSVSIHSGTVTFEKGEIVRRLGSETLHFSNRSTGVNPEDCRPNFVAIFSWVALT